MANEKLITLDLLGYNNDKIEEIIRTGDAKSIKSANFSNNTLSFYTSEDKSGDAIVTFNLPEEQFLDQTKTVFVNNFAWSDTTYPNSTNPNLEGKPVLVLAVKGDTDVSYSFVSLESLIDIMTGVDSETATITISSDNKISVNVKVSAEANNSVVVKEDGIYVPKTTLTYATEADIDALYNS